MQCQIEFFYKLINFGDTLYSSLSFLFHKSSVFFFIKKEGEIFNVVISFRSHWGEHQFYFLFFVSFNLSYEHCTSSVEETNTELSMFSSRYSILFSHALLLRSRRISKGLMPQQLLASSAIWKIENYATGIPDHHFLCSFLLFGFEITSKAESAYVPPIQFFSLIFCGYRESKQFSFFISILLTILHA